MPIIPLLASGQVAIIDPGQAVQVVSALAAASTGTANSQLFTVQPRGEGADRSLVLDAVPNGAVTTVTADLEISTDNQVSFQKFKTGLALIAASVSTAAVVNNVQSGATYRVNVTTNTAGTSVTINATAQ